MGFPLAAFALVAALDLAPAPRHVLLETRILAISPAAAEKVRSMTGLQKGQTSTTLDDRLAAKVLDAMAREASTDILAAPRVTTTENQPARISCGQQEHITTGLEVQVKEGQAVCVPKHDTVFVGYKLECSPALAKDGGTIRLDIDSSLSSRPASPVRTPFTYQVTPEFEGGGKGEPVPVTQWIESSAIDVQQVKAKITSKPGETVLIPGGSQVVQSNRARPIPVLNRIPYIGRLFSASMPVQEKKEYFLLVTARVID